MRPSRTTRAVPAFLLAMLVSLWLAPAAHAQLGGGIGDAIGTTTGAIGDAVGGVTDGLEGSSGGSSADDDGSTESGGGGLVGGIVKEVEKGIDSGTESVGKVVEETGDTFGNVGSDTIGGTVQTIEETLGSADAATTGSAKKHKKTRSEERTTTSSPAAGRVVVLGNSLADALQADNKALAVSTGGWMFSSAAEPPVEESLVSQIGRIATEAARQAAFPLALTLMVIAFLMVQNRLDKRDPKLALAPVDSEHDLLSFT